MPLDVTIAGTMVIRRWVRGLPPPMGDDTAASIRPAAEMLTKEEEATR